MALTDLLPGDTGADARAKINAGFAEARKVADLAASVAAQGTTLTAQAGTLATALGSVATLTASEAETKDAVADLAEREEAAAQSLADLAATVSRTMLGASLGTRPGDFPMLFSSAIEGDGPTLPPLDPAGCIASPFGTIYRLAGAGIVALRAAVWLEPDAFWSMRLLFRRLANATDPNNHAVDVAIQWLDGAYQAIGLSLVQRYSGLKRSDGPVGLTIRIPSLAGERPAIVPPKGAVFWRPYLRTYGNDGETAVESLVVADVTNAGVFAPDLSALAARMTSLEGVIAAGIPFSTPILPAYPVADLPKPGTPGRKAFASDGRAPNAAGILDPANGGTGVEVVDNGTNWVIGGTNQVVEA